MYKKTLPLVVVLLLFASCKGPEPELFAGADTMVYIPAGEFIMGTDPKNEKQYPKSFGMEESAYKNESPQRRVQVEGFYIDKYEVTLAGYKKFLDATGHELPQENFNDVDVSKVGNHPILMVSWNDAAAYAEWAGKRLPTEEEWEKAARGPNGQRFTWREEEGEKFNEQSSFKDVIQVGMSSVDVSPYGIHDMGANVSEWTADWYKPYPGNDNPDEDYGEKHRVVRGGWAWGGGHYFITYFYRGAFRHYAPPEEKTPKIGFRCAVSLSEVDALKKRQTRLK